MKTNFHTNIKIVIKMLTNIYNIKFIHYIYDIFKINKTKIILNIIDCNKILKT